MSFSLTQFQDSKSLPINGVKLHVNKSHKGPRSVSDSRKSQRLSASANKVRVLFDVNLTSAPKSEDQGKNQWHDKVIGYQDLKGPELVALFEAWDRVASDTDNYTEAYNLFTTNRVANLNSLGIHNPSGSADLTASEREAYNIKMRPFAFKFFEYQLALKTAEGKWVRSKVIHSLKPLDTVALMQKVEKRALKILSEYKLTEKESAE